MNLIEHQNQFACGLGSSVEVDCGLVKAHYENMTVDAGHHQMFVAIYFSRGIREQFDLTPEAFDIFRYASQYPSN